VGCLATVAEEGRGSSLADWDVARFAATSARTVVALGNAVGDSRRTIEVTFV